MKTHRINLVNTMLIALLFLTVFTIQNYCQIPDTPERDLSFLDDLGVVRGPENIKMGQIASIKIAQDYIFLDGGDTRTLMERFGNPASNNEEGLIADREFNWFVVFEFSNVGYVPDDEKDDLDADEILETIIEANEEANKIREKSGWGKLIITGWELTPRYNQLTNNLEWAIRGRDDMGYPVINHSTRLLGRKGVMELTLVVDPTIYKEIVPLYADVMQTFSFQQGQKYAEYREGDKVAEYGLTALVVGGGTAIAAKSGLLKYLWKILIGVFIAVSAFFKRIYNKLFKKNTE